MKNATITAIVSVLILLLPNIVLAQVVIALDGQLDKYWVVEKKMAPKYPRMALRRGIMGCAAVGYIIKADGSTSKHKVLGFYPSGVFDKSAIKAAKQFVYNPSEQNPDKVSVITLNVFTYTVSTDDNDHTKKQDILSETCTAAGKKALGVGNTEDGKN